MLPRSRVGLPFNASNSKNRNVKSLGLEVILTTHNDPTIEMSSPPPDISDDDGASSTQIAPNMRVVKQGKRVHFADETEGLLRLRLKAAAINLMCVLGLGYVLNAYNQNHAWILLRTLILVSIVLSYFYLRTRPSIKIGVLRFIEALLFGGVAVQVGLMMYSRVRFYAVQGDAISMASAESFYFTAFCLHILTYGIFIPNTWKRACVVSLAIAAIPYSIWFYVSWAVPEFGTLSALNHAKAPLPTTLVACLIGTFGSHIIHRTRREAFQAKQILQYKLHEQIGSGGMGEVYRAEHVLLKRPCAIKLIRSDKNRDKLTLERFEREVIATAKLSHWNTVDIYDYGHTDDGTFYYVMELLRGENLQTIVERFGPLPPERVASVLSQACDALHEAHQTGLIHRDIKPANIYLARCGGVWDVVKVLDFGLVLEKDDSGVATSGSKGFSGTPQFMAPEQAVRFDEVDARTDIYALGAVAYYLLTGRPPFSGANAVELVIAHSTQPVIPPSTYDHSIPSDLEQIVLTCLQKFPSNRYASARQMREAISQCECFGKWGEPEAFGWWSSHEFGTQRTSIPESTSNVRAENIPTIEQTEALNPLA